VVPAVINLKIAIFTSAAVITWNLATFKVVSCSYVSIAYRAPLTENPAINFQSIETKGLLRADVTIDGHCASCYVSAWERLSVTMGTEVSVGRWFIQARYRSVCRTLVYTGAVQKCL
jgi:hypothetical protein